MKHEVEEVWKVGRQKNKEKVEKEKKSKTIKQRKS